MIRVILVAAAALLVLGGVAAVGTVAVGLSTFRVLTDNQPLPSAMRSLTIDTGDIPTSIRLTTEPDATEPNVRLRMVKSNMGGDHKLTVADDAGTARVTLDGQASRHLHWARAGEITVALPPGLAPKLTVTTQQNSGMLSAETDLDRLVARSTNGLVILEGSARNVEVQANNGQISTREPISVSESFSATVNNGDINVDFTDAPQTVQATTRSGNVRLALPGPGPYDVRAQGVSTTVRVPETTESGAPQVTARSESGNVTIEQRR